MGKTKKRRGGEKAPRSNKPAREGSVLDYKSWCVSHPPNSRTLNKSKKAYSDMTPEEKEEFCPPIKGELTSAPPSAPPSQPPSRSVTPPPPPAAVFAGPPPPPAATKEEQRQAKLARLQGRFRTKGGPENEESSDFGGRSRRRRRSRKNKRKTKKNKNRR